TGLTYNKPKDNFDRKKMPPAGDNPVVKVPDFWKKSLDKSISVIGVENNEIPVVNLNIYLKGGSILEQNDLKKAGLSSLFASMMNEDTKDRSSEDISLELEKLGSSISVYNSTDAIVFSVQSLSKNLDSTIKILERSEEHTSELQSRENLVCRLLLEK